MSEIGLEGARRMVRAAMDHAASNGLKPLAVSVLDSGGHLVAFERADGATPGRVQIAEAKAYGAVMLGMSGSAQRDRAESQAYFMAAANGALGGRLVPVPGGVLVRDSGGAIAGAVGISGDVSDNDAAAAVAGIEAAGFTAEA